MEDKGSFRTSQPGQTRHENGFSMSLPMVVEGTDALGAEFKEETLLSFMSHKMASFDLKAPVLAGTKLKLIVALPPRLSEGDDLKLAVRGDIFLVESSPENKKLQRVFLNLESRYIISPSS
jgi:hypothetical protein